jgi:hypothetical protein
MTMTGLDKWYDYVKSHDRAVLWDLLHPDVVFESPVVHTPQRGRDITFKYLWSVGKVLGGSGFAFVGEWRNDTGGPRIRNRDRRDQAQRRRHHHLRGRWPGHAFQGDGAPAQGGQPAASADGGATGEAVRR